MASFIRLTDRTGDMVVVNIHYVVIVEDLTGCDKPTNTRLVYLVAGRQEALYVQESIERVAALLVPGRA